MTDDWSTPRIPRLLASTLHPELHPDVIDTKDVPTLATAVADWAETAQPASRRAKATVEPYLAKHLAAVAAVGRARGRRVALWSAIPVAVVLLAVAMTILAIR